MSGGFGGGSFGGGPWGGSSFSSSPTPPPPSDFDVFCFVNTPTSMGLILANPDVSIRDSGGQFTINLSNDLVVSANNDETAILEVTTTVPATRTLEFVLKIDSIPSDFSNIPESHIFVGTFTGTSTCAGFFISAAGLAYVGGVHYDGTTGQISIDSVIQPIPGSSAYVTTGEFLSYRVAIDSTSQTLYLYVTSETDVLAGKPLVLRAILPTFDADTLAFPPVPSTVISAIGQVLAPVHFEVRELCLSSHLLIANLAPVADAGNDQSVEMCSVIRLDGSASFDPEGANLLYSWKLIDAPLTSGFSVSGSDGQTFPVDMSGFTNKLYSVSLSSLLDPVSAGDTVLIDGDARIINMTGTDGHGYFVQFTTQDVPDSLSNVQFKLLRQNGIFNADKVLATFMPDVAGFYRFELIVSDGQLSSSPATVVFNVLEALIPRGVVPDVSFLFGLMSDFWGLVEDRDRITTLWSGVAQVVAGELLTLWQHDYAKSLRDIQRQFTRKWLHYDLLLPEPLPELTVVSGVNQVLISTVFNAPTTYTYGNTNLTIASPAFGVPLSIDFHPGAVDTNFPAGFVQDLNLRLKQVDPRFSVRAGSWSSGTKLAVIIQSAVAFQILACTLPTVTSVLTSSNASLFQVNQLSEQPNGTSSADNDVSRFGAAVSSNTYQVSLDLSATGIQPGQLLCIDGFAYQIVSIIPIGDETCWVVVKETLPANVSHTWKMASTVTSQLLDFWNGLVSAGDAVALEIAQSDSTVPTTALQYELFKTTVLGINSSLTNVLPIDLAGLPADLSSLTTAVYLASVLRRRYLPVSSLVLDVPTLGENIVVTTEAEEESVLRRNVDFTLEDIRDGTGIHFITLADGNDLDVWESKDPPSRLWAEFTYIDNGPVIEQNFGIPVEFTLDDIEALGVELDYLSAVRGLWYAYFNGPTLKNLRIGTQILLGLPFAEEAGTIEELRTDFSPTLGRLLIRDTANAAIVRTYTYPRALDLEINPATGQRYVVGDSVAQFAPLVEGASIVDYIKDPQWFRGILNQGIFREVEKYFRFLVKVDSAAFHLSALLAVKDFIIKVKPTYTYPLIVVESGGDREDDISIDDTMTENVTVNLSDNPCGGYFGSSTTFDDYNGSGIIRNQFDTDADPGTPPPTFPTSDSPILWAFDKEWLCPEDFVVGEVSTRFSGTAAVQYGMCFLFGSSYTPIHKFLKTGGPPISVPASPSSLTVPHDPIDPVAGVVHLATGLVSVVVRTKGTVGDAPSNSYKLYVDVNGTPPPAPETFTMSGPNGTASFPLTVPLGVSPGDVVTVRLQVASGSARNEAWTMLEVTVYQAAVPDLHFGDTLPAGTYRTIRQLSP
jgi:hypothetical protein